MASFQDVLNVQASAVEAPKPLPVGTYLAIVDGPPEIAKVGKNQTDCINFKLKLMQAQSDVDQTALQEYLNGGSLASVTIKHTLWGTNDESKIAGARYRIKQFLVDHLGLEEGTKMIGELLPEAQGRQVMVTLGHRVSDDAQIYSEIKQTAKV